MKKFIGGLVIIAIIAAIAVPRIMEAVNSTSEVEEVGNVVTVGGQQIAKGDLANTVELIGTTTALQSVSVFPKMPAEVDTINVVAGDYVKEGDVLFVLDASSVEDQVTQAEIGLTLAKVGVKNAKAGVTQAQIGYDLSQSNYTMQYASYNFGASNVEKYAQLFEEGVVSELEYEQMKLQASPETINLLEKQLAQAASSRSMASLGVESANAQLMQAQEGFNSASELLVDMTVVAPISGYVSTNNLSEGNMASNAQPAMQLDDISEIIVTINVTEAMINKLSLGMNVDVNVGAVGEKVYPGVIDQLNTTADARTLLYPVKVRVSNDKEMIKPGMFATVDIETESSKSALYVPSEAVILRDGLRYVYLQRGESDVERVEVMTGIDTGYFTEIKEGVTAEDVIITNGIGLIDEKSTIKMIRSDQ